MRTLRNKKTGEVIQVEDSEAAQYLNPQPQSTATNSAGEQEIYKKMLLTDLLTTGGKNMTKIEAIGKIISPEKDTKAAATLRKEFASETKNLGYQTYKNALNAATDPDATDLTIMYSYIKSLDPTSVVREGEINLARAQESLGSDIVRRYKKIKEGGTMSPKVRQEMISEIARMYNDRAKQQQELNAFYTGLAKDSGVDSNDVIGGVGDIKLADVVEPQVPAKKGITPGGLLGGLLGGAGGFMVGGPVGAGVGGAIGAGAGGATQNMILDVLGKQTEEPMDQLKQVSGQALNTGLTASAVASLLPGILKMGGKAIGINAGKAATQTAGSGIKNKVVNIGEKIESLNPARIMRNEQFKAADQLSKTKINPKEVEKTIKPLLDKVPSLKSTYKEYEGVVKSIKNPRSALEALDIFKDAFTQAGKVKSGLEPKLLKMLYEATAKQLPQQVAVNRTLTKYAIEVPKTAGKALWRATLGKVLMGT